MNSYGIESLPVVDDSNVFLGVVYLRDLRGASREDTVGKIRYEGLPYVTLNTSLEQAMEMMTRSKTRWLPVVERNKFLGIINA